MRENFNAVPTEDINDFFSTQGYFLEKSVLDVETVCDLRPLILDLFQKKYGTEVGLDKRFLYGEDTLHSQALIKACFSAKIINRLKSMIGDRFMVIPTFQIQVSNFGLSGSQGWHFDCRSEMPNSYLQRPDYCFVKCVICLQDNSLEYGGGLDILPGSHRIPKIGNIKANFVAQRIKAGIFKKKHGLRLPLQAGDVLIFDSRLYHRSSPPSESFMKNVSKEELDGGYIFMKRFNSENIKINLLFDVCRAPFGDYYMQHSVKRANKEIESLRAQELFYSQYCSLDYPNDFPSYFTKKMRENEIEVAYVKDQALRERFKNYLRKCDQSSSSNQ